MSPSVKPFDEAKYKALMDGLECSEIYKSELERTLRIDSEFYSKEYLDIVSAICKNNTSPLTEFVHVSDGNHAGISDNFTDSGIPYYRGQDAGNFFIENCLPICIDKDTFNLPIMHRSHLKKNDVLLSIVGTIGALSLVYSNKDATCSCKLAILRPKKSETSELLAVFLSGKYGQQQIKRYTRGAVQKGLILEDMDQLVFPCFENVFINIIRSIVIKAHDTQESAKESYDTAQDFLCSLLNIDDISTKQDLVSEKNISVSFGVSGRLDAEYYQPKYDALFDTLSKFPTKKLGGKHGIVSIVKSIEPGSEAYVDHGIPFIRVSDISKFEISEPTIKLVPTVIPTPETLFPKKDTILFSKDGSIGIAYKLEEDIKAITSGALLHLSVRNKDEILPDYLTLVLNSPIVQLQAERDCNGAVIQHWKPSEIENVIIPVFDMDVQKEIAAKVQESFALRKQSKLLLEYAKQAVEMAIEQGEETATRWLDSKMKEENYDG